MTLQTNPLVSVIVPVYNCEKFLEKCVASITNQVYTALEIILVDDGSSDASSSIGIRLSESDKRIHYFHQRNSGPSKARNKGISEANGEYLMFVDADDTLAEDAIPTLIKIVRTTDSQLISFNFATFNEAGTKISKTNAVLGSYPSDRQSSGIGCLKHIYHEDGIGNFSWAFLYQAQLFDNTEIRFPDNIRLFEDALFLNKALSNVSSVSYCPIALYNYVIRQDSSLTKSPSLADLTGGLAAERTIRGIASKVQLLDDYYPHAIQLLFFIKSRIHCIDADSESFDQQVSKEILATANEAGARTISIKNRLKIFLLFTGLYTFISQGTKSLRKRLRRQ
ncbi:glycosyltransferase family 2 protein [Bifidobacterium sp.]|uniref:glycosyltransferase family 2 protein n=1 Tax=Bifidobacterium sp. TaxID=41200 RepID=UPI0039EAAFE1